MGAISLTTVDELVDSIASRLESQAKCLGERLDAWLCTLEVVGLAIARVPESSSADIGMFELNPAAQADLDLPEARIRRAELHTKIHDVLWQDSMTVVWRPQSQQHLADLAKLTPREQEVLDWMQQGKTIAETAILMSISERTVEKHRENLSRKVKAASEGEA